MPAQPPPPMRHQTGTIDWKFGTLTGTLAAATAYDVMTTFDVLTRCSACRETNPILRPFVESGKPATYAFLAAVDAGIMWTSYRLKKDHKWYWWIGPVVWTGAHAILATRNARVGRLNADR